ncbi:hypothetical protein TNCV_3415721 [Trichonephila clavipes]|nr:hypothetical protein TNCV_3415721 [Trichonephila clavipes]
MGGLIPNVFQPESSYGSRRHRGPHEGATFSLISADEAVGVHLLRCGGLFDDWICLRRPEPGLRVNDISRFNGPNSSSHNTTRAGLIDELLN